MSILVCSEDQLFQNLIGDDWTPRIWAKEQAPMTIQVLYTEREYSPVNPDLPQCTGKP